MAYGIFGRKLLRMDSSARMHDIHCYKQTLQGVITPPIEWVVASHMTSACPPAPDSPAQSARQFADDKWC